MPIFYTDCSWAHGEQVCTLGSGPVAVARGMTSSHNFFVSQIEKNSTTTLNRSQCACLMRKCVISVGLDGFVSRSRRCFLSRARYRRRRLFDHDPWKYDTFLPRRDLAGRWPDLISSFCSFPPPPRMRYSVGILALYYKFAQFCIPSHPLILGLLCNITIPMLCSLRKTEPNESLSLCSVLYNFSYYSLKIKPNPCP